MTGLSGGLGFDKIFFKGLLMLRIVRVPYCFWGKINGNELSLYAGEPMFAGKFGKDDAVSLLSTLVFIIDVVELAIKLVELL